MIHRIGIGFDGLDGPLDGAGVTAHGLHGLLYHVLRKHDRSRASWLHEHRPPKPYTIAPYYTDLGRLAGIRMTALTGRTAELLLGAWRAVSFSRETLSLGSQKLVASRVEGVPGPDYKSLSALMPASKVGLRFLSPTSFRQGPGDLPLPLPANVFRGPFENWQAFCGQGLDAPGDWLQWCAENVFVSRHRIETVTVNINWNEPFTGFVGDVEFEALDNALLYQGVLQSLAALAPFCGIGRKTTMGMGAVEQIGEET